MPSEENRFLPREFAAGLTLQSGRALGLSPAEEWAVTIYLRGPSAIDLVASFDGSRHSITAPADTTKSWAPGRYWYVVRASRGAEVREVERGELKITPDIAAAGANFDGRSENQTALDAINAVLSRRATMDQERYTINNRELWRTPIPDLLKLRAFYATQVRRERGGSGIGRQIPVAFR